MTRKEIEQLNVVIPYCFESDREEEWYQVGLKDGLEVADKEPLNRWISVKDDLPYRYENLIMEDNPNQTKEVLVRLVSGYVTVTRMSMNKNGLWKFPFDVTHWMIIPEFIQD